MSRLEDLDKTDLFRLLTDFFSQQFFFYLQTKPAIGANPRLDYLAIGSSLLTSNC